MTHTPRPWIVLLNTYQVGRRYPGKLLVTATAGGHTAEETQANARLIAAAPDMALELQNARNLIALALQNGAWGEESTDEQDSAEEAASVLAGIDNILNQATGAT